MDSSIGDHLIARFIAETNATIDHATFFLQACDGNYDRAVQMYREQAQPAPPNRAALPRGNIPPRPQAPLGRAILRRGAPDLPFRLARALLSIPLAILHSSVRIATRTLGFSFSFLGAIVHRVLPRALTAPVHTAVRTLIAPPAPEDPATAAAAFAQYFVSRHGDNGPSWQECGWQEAATRAHVQGRFLFVYLHASRHQDADEFCSATLCAPAVVDYINANFFCWAGDLRTADAFRLASNVRAAAFPYCGLLAFSGTRTRLVTSVEGFLNPETLIDTLHAALQTHNELLRQERSVSERREADRRLREEQDEEYRRALEADREREALVQAEKERFEALEQEKARAEAAVAEEERRQAEVASAVERRRTEKRLSLPEEPPAGTPDTALLRVRFPSGSTQQRRFLKSDTLQTVHDWVDAIEGHGHLRYSLATTIPRRVLTAETAAMGQTLESLKLEPPVVLLVQPEGEDA